MQINNKNVNVSKLIITPENYYKRDGVYTIEEKILEQSDNLKSTGFVNFNVNRYEWGYKLYNLMIANQWTVQEVDTSNEKKDFANLTEDEKDIYRTVFASLSFLDSSQEEYILDFRKYVTNRNLKAALTKQAETEVLHSDGYKVLLEKTGVSEEVFELHRTNDIIATKAERVASQFAKYINQASNPKNFLYAGMGSVNLEGVYFLTGFSLIFLMGDKVPGARDMIKFILSDENIHLAMFANIMKTIMREHPMTAKDIDQVYREMEYAVETELEFGKALIKDKNILGLDETVLEDTIKNYANNRLRAIGLEYMYEPKEKTFLQKLVDKNSKLNDKRENFFETNVTSYSKNSLNFENF